MLIYYYYTNSKYSKLLSKEIDCLFDIYKKTYKVRVTDEKSLKYTIGNVLFNCSRAVNNKQDIIVFVKNKRFFSEGIIIDGKRCKIKLSYDFFIKVLDVLEAEDYIDVVTGGDFIYKEHTDTKGDTHYINTGKRNSSYFIIKSKLDELVRDKVVKYEMSNVLILRDEDKNDMEFKPTQLQLQDIDFLRGFNSHIAEFEFKDKNGDIIAEPFLRRIFNTSFELGGRFYTQSGVVQTMTPEDRLKVTINGKKVKEIDVSALHPSIIASKAGIKVDYDPYDFEVPANIDYEAIEEHKKKYGKFMYNPVRNLNKICVLLAINNRTRGAAINSINKKIRDDHRLPEKDRMYYGINELDVNLLYVNMENRNIGISESFGSNQGAIMQFYDSMWMERVLSYIVQADIPAIPIHDSILCPAEHASEVERFMELAYKQSFGDTYNFKVKVKQAE